jgi:cation transport regulator ChaB
VLLRLLGSARVRRMALQDLAALSEDAWERRLAFPWLVRLSFEVPAALAAALPAEERDFIMETQEWFEQFTARKVEEGMQEALPKAVQEALPKAVQEAVQKALPKAVQEALPKAVQEALPKAVQEAKESWRLETTARLCQRRLGRPLTEIENAALTDRIDRLGGERVEDVILSSSPDVLGVWLADPNAI